MKFAEQEPLFYQEVTYVRALSDGGSLEYVTVNHEEIQKIKDSRPTLP